MADLSILMKAIQNAARELVPRIIFIRRHLHQHPELSFKEYNTCSFVCDELEALQIPFEKMIGTGIVARIEGRNPTAKTIALRADLDALPITEKIMWTINLHKKESCMPVVMMFTQRHF